MSGISRLNVGQSNDFFLLKVFTFTVLYQINLQKVNFGRMNVWSETSLYRKGRSEISWKKPLLEGVQIEHFSSNCRLAVKCELSGMLFWIKDYIYIYTWKCAFWRHQFTHVCVLTFGACEAQTSLTIMFEFEKIFRSCCTCPWHTYIYIYILLLGPVCHLFSQDYARSWSVAWGGPRDLDGWQRQWYAVGVFFCEVYIGLEPLVWKVQEAFIYNIYIYISFVCYIDESGRRLVHSKEMILASRWSVAWRTFYRQILSLLYI